MTWNACFGSALQGMPHMLTADFLVRTSVTSFINFLIGSMTNVCTRNPTFIIYTAEIHKKYFPNCVALSEKLYCWLKFVDLRRALIGNILVKKTLVSKKIDHKVKPVSSEMMGIYLEADC